MFLIYGATGYTGGLIARMAVQQGLQPIIAGRTASKLQPLVDELGIEYRAFSLDTPQLDGVTVLLNCAGPFARSATPLIEGCLQSGTHYLDIAGEVDDIEVVRAYDERAKSAGIMLLPAVGFGVVPTDCMAAHMQQRLPSATHLTIAFQTVGGASQGTLSTVIGNLHLSGYTRQDGQLIPTKPATKSRTFDFGNGTQSAVLNPWRGDLTTAYVTTGIRNIEAYSAFPNAVQSLMKAHWLHGFWGSDGFQNLLKWVFKRLPEGPSEAELNNGHTHIVIEAIDGNTTIVSRLHGAEAYRFTGNTALAIVRAILDGQSNAGFQTPAGMFGEDFILDVEGVTREDG